MLARPCVVAQTSHAEPRRADAARTSVVAKAVREIQEMIRSGRFAPGAGLPGQRELAAELGASRASLREALSILTTLGMVRVEPRRGTVVPETAEPEEAQRPFDDVQWRFGARYTPEEVYQFRVIAEGQAASLAAMHLSDEELGLLQRNQQVFKEATRQLDSVSSSRHDFEFHHLIMRFSRNRMLVHLHRTYDQALLESQRLQLAERGRVWEPVVEHQRILNALAMRDPDGAGYYMRAHITRAAERVGVSIVGIA
jgi:GntR family transcriptional regulator, transcriptional repressor for pyruvate dehydrogenase complex